MSFKPLLITHHSSTHHERKRLMNCWHCDTELIWGGDHDTEDNEDYDIVSNLSCPECHSFVEVYHPSEKLIKEYEDDRH